MTSLDNQGLYFGHEHQEVELVNWEEIFKPHVAETRRLDRETETRIERAQKS